jgi:hypothetical protein
VGLQHGLTYFSCNVKTKTYIEERTEIFNSREAAFATPPLQPQKEGDLMMKTTNGFERPRPPGGRQEEIMQFMHTIILPCDFYLVVLENGIF